MLVAACSPDSISVYSASDSDLVAFVVTSESGDALRLARVTSDPFRVSIADGERGLVVTIPADRLMLAGGPGELALGLDSDPSAGTCGRCAIPTAGAPQPVFPGDLCPIPGPIEAYEEGVLAPSALAESVRARLRVSRPGSCLEPKVALASTAQSQEIRWLEPEVDAEPPGLGVVTPGGATALVNQRFVQWSHANGQTSTVSIALEGALLGASVIDADRILIASAGGEGTVLTVVGRRSVESQRTYDLGASSNIRLASLPGGGAWVIRFGASTFWVIACAASGCGEPMFIADTPIEAWEAIGLDASTIVAVGDLGTQVLERVGDSVALVSRSARKVWSRHRSPSLGRVGDRAIACVRDSLTRESLVLSVSRPDLARWDEVLTSSASCEGLFHHRGELIVPFDDGHALAFGPAGAPRATTLAALGATEILDLYLVSPASPDGFVAISDDDSWHAGTNGALRVVYQEPSLPSWTADVGGADEAVLVGKQSVRRIDARGASVSKPLSLPDAALGVARSSVDRSLWVVGDGFGAIVDLDGSTRALAMPPGSWFAVTEIAPGRAVAIGDGHRVVEISGELVRALSVQWDDPSTIAVEDGPARDGDCRIASKQRPPSWVAIDSRGDGVAWLVGCAAMAARAVAGPDRITVQALRIDSPEFIPTTALATRDFRTITALGPLQALIDGSRGVVEVRTDSASSRVDALFTELVWDDEEARITQILVNDRAELTVVEGALATLRRPTAARPYRRIFDRSGASAAVLGSTTILAFKSGRIALSAPVP